MGVNGDVRYFGACCLQSEQRSAGLARCAVPVQLRWLLGKKRGQICKPAQVPKDQQGLHAMTCGQASLPGEAAPAFPDR